MNVIVTTLQIEYENFIKTDSLKNASSIVGDIDVLVYHTCIEQNVSDRVEILSRLKDRVSTLIYIRNKEYLDSAIQVVTLGSNGKYIDDEFFLESSEELNKLVKSLAEVTRIVSLSGVSVLSDFFNRYLQGDSSEFNTNYLTVVKQAVKNMIQEYHEKDLEIIQLSTTATELFTSSSEILSKLREEQEKLQNMVSHMKESKSDPFKKSKEPQGLVFFPVVSYLKDRPIVRIKNISSCYLTSFILGFKKYLEKSKLLKPRVLFIEPVGRVYENVYSEYTWISQFNLHEKESDKDILFTNYPSRDLLNKILDSEEYNMFIIVDKTVSSDKHILNCKGRSVKYAVNSTKQIKKFNLKVSNCFSSINDIAGTMFTLPAFANYPAGVNEREMIYMRNCIDFYDRLVM